MKRGIVSVAVVLTAVSCVTTAAARQADPGDQSQIEGVALTQAVVSAKIIGLQAQQARLGEAIIKAGKATTRIAAQPATSVVVALEGADRVESARKLAAFQSLVSRSAFTRYDMADGFALAFVMAFEAYTGKPPGAVRLRNLRASLRSQLLKSALSQGETMTSRQRQYENMGISAVSAIEARRRGDIDLARRWATPVLERLWPKPVVRIELAPGGFGDRGERLVGSGTAKATYKRSGDRSVAAVAAAIGPVYPEPTPAYLQTVPGRFDAEVRARGGKLGDAADELATVFVLQARARRHAEASDPATFRRAQAYLRTAVTTDPSWLGLEDAAKSAFIDRAGFKAVYLVDQLGAAFSTGADAAGDEMRRVFTADFLAHMGVRIS